MTKKTLFWAILAMILVYAGSIMAGVPMMKDPSKYKIIDGSEPAPNVQYIPSQPGMLTDSPGIMVGETQYDYQTNGSTGHRLVVDSQGGVHFAWMRGLDYAAGLREVWFNYVSSSNSWLGATSASQANGDGYIQIAVSSDDRAALAYHRGGTSNTDWFALDTFSGVGVFDYFTVPNALGSARLMWPYISRDRNSRYHVVITDNTTAPRQTLGYTRSTNDGATWTTLARVDTLTVISPVVVSSPVSDKVAIVYNHPTDTTQYRNDVYYIQSTDGTTWNYATGKINVTHYNRRDSVYAYTDVAAAYDYNDNLHIIWTSFYTAAAGGIYYESHLNHFDVSSGTITLITIAADSSFWLSTCDTGGWNMPISKMSIGVKSNNELFVAYTRFDTSDCSAGGFANGEIYMNRSNDGGHNWDQGVNLTSSPTPGCQPGDCDSDHWSSIAEKVDDFVHLFYVNDKDAGGIPQTEGTITDNPMLYLKYGVTGIDDNTTAPRSFSLKQNYPNPFNAQTNIDFNLEKNSRVELAVYNLLGAKVATLVNGQMEAGAHSVNFDASKVSSGIYYYSLKTNGSEVTKKMTLLK